MTGRAMTEARGRVVGDSSSPNEEESPPADFAARQPERWLGGSHGEASMDDLFLLVLAGHLLGDFVTQTD